METEDVGLAPDRQGRRRRPRRSLLVVVVAALAVAASCSSSDPTDEGAVSPIPSEEGVTPVEGLGDGEIPAGGVEAEAQTQDDGPPPEAIVQLEGEELEEHLARRYEAYWDAFDAARGAPTASPATDFPLLSDLAAGEQLDVSYASVIDLSEKGEAIREPEAPAIEGIDANAEHRVRIDLVDGTVAEITGCVVNDDVRHVVADGTIVRDGVTTVMSRSTMALTEGQWKLIRSRAVEISDGVTGCWLTDEFPY